MQLTQSDLESMLGVATELATQAGQRLRDTWQSAKDFQMKDERDLVTTLDTEIEEHFKQVLTERYPKIGFWGEETERTGADAEYSWLIDPIDGTKYFAAEIPLFTVSIGLMRGDEPILGVVYNPISDQLFAGAQGIPATVNGRPIRVSATSELRNAMVSLDYSRIYQLKPDRIAWVQQKLGTLSIALYRPRMFGNGSLSLCFVALGALDGYVDLGGNVKPQDVAAGLAIAKAAGAKLERFHSPFSDHWLVTNGGIHTELIDLLSAE